MFGRKKNKDERRDKKRHKPGMSAAELSKLEEVGMRRGFFSKISGMKKEKDEYFSVSSNNVQAHTQDHQKNSSESENAASVLEKATRYGSVVQRRVSQSSPPSTRLQSVSEDSLVEPVPPARIHSWKRNASQSSNINRNSLNHSPAYDHPKPPVRTKSRISSEYNVPVASKTSHRNANETAARKALSQRNRRTSSGNSTNLLHQRKVVLKKRQAGDFGLSLRRSTVVEYNNGQAVTKTAYFAEPGVSMLNEVSYSDTNPDFLHYGDRLVEIDGVNVETSAREEIVNRIKSAGSVVTLIVKKTPETNHDSNTVPDGHYSIPHGPKAEFSSTNINEENAKQMEAGDLENPEYDYLPPGISWLSGDSIWFKHADGISRANLVAPDPAVGDAGGNLLPLPEGKCRIQLEASQKKLLVSEDDIDTVNPEEFDRTSDLAAFRFLNESSMLYTLSLKHKSGLRYTYVGPNLLVLQTPDDIQSIYSQQVKVSYKDGRFGEDQPHIYATSQDVYKNMMSGGEQSIVNVGYNVAGKPSNSYHMLEFFAGCYTNASCNVKVDKIAAVKNVMHSFSCVETKFCKSASRSVNIFELNFDKTGMLNALTLQTMLFDHTHVTKRSTHQLNFNIFYQLVFGASNSVRNELLLPDGEHDANPLLLGQNFRPDVEFTNRARDDFALLLDAFHTLGFGSDERKSLLHVTAACLHLAMAGCQKLSGNRYQFARADSAQKAAILLGTTVDKLCANVFVPSRKSRSSSLGHSNKAGFQNQRLQPDKAKSFGEQMLDSFLISLYKEVFQVILQLMNRSTTSIGKSHTTVMVVDAPGYQTDSQQRLTDFIYNYVQDRLCEFFHHHAITRRRDRYEQEGIELDTMVPESGCSGVDVLDKSTRRVGDANGGKSLFRLLEEEAGSAGGTAESFVERLHYNVGHNSEEAKFVSRSRQKSCFVFRHHMSSCAVEYDTTDWLQQNFYTIDDHAVIELLQDSKKMFICEMFGGSGGGGKSSPAETASPSLRRVASFRKNFVSTSNKSLCTVAKTQMDNLMERIERTTPHFVLSLVTHSPKTGVNQAASFNFKLVRSQLQGFKIVDVARFHKQGYPKNMVMAEFRRRFDVLGRKAAQNREEVIASAKETTHLSDKEAVDTIVHAIEMDKSLYRIGITEIFFRSGVLNHIEDLRNDVISSTIICLQSRCRGFLARRRFEKRKVQDIAVRCLQRNIRKFMGVRQWPWWKLVTKIRPLVEVNRVDDELREKEAELELMKEKLDRTVKERDEATDMNAKYETKIHEIMHHLEDEQATASNAWELLDREMKEKNNLESVIQDLQTKCEEWRTRVDEMEVELAEKKIIFGEPKTDLGLDDEDADIDYKMKYERCAREFEFKLEQKARENEDALEEIRDNKKALERKLIQMQDEVDEHVRIETQSKKKMHKLHADLGDAKIHLEETTAKNHELEKKQRRFDSELQLLQNDVTDLKSARDRLQREKDRLSFDHHSQTKEMEDKNEELEVALNKVKLLEQELDESNSRDTDDRQQVTAMKKKIRELEAKVADQEEELDEQAGTIQTLEQTKERMRMSSEQTSRQFQREVTTKEEEFEEIRSSYHKKVKQLEQQLQEADDERAAQHKHRREVEQQLFDLKQRAERGGEGSDSFKRMKRDLKCYKTMMSDAQAQIDHFKTDAVNKQQMRQLKTKLEEAEYACSAAVKSRKAMELEIEDLQVQLDDISKAKQESESRASSLQHELHALQSKLEEDGEDATETMHEYRNLVTAHSEQRDKMVELQATVDQMKNERAAMQDRITALQSEVDFMQQNMVDRATANRLESKVKDLETKLQFQKASMRRLEVQLGRAKENHERAMSERDAQASSAQRERDTVKRVHKQLREAKDEQGELIKKELEALQKKHELEVELEEHKNQIESLQSDLKLAFKRIGSLQNAFEELDDDSDVELDYSLSESDDDSESGDDRRSGRSSNFARSDRLSVSSARRRRDRRSFASTSSLTSHDHDELKYRDVDEKEEADLPPSPR